MTASQILEMWGGVLADEFPNLTPVLLLCTDGEKLRTLGTVNMTPDVMYAYLRSAASARQKNERCIEVDIPDEEELRHAQPYDDNERKLREASWRRDEELFHGAELQPDEIDDEAEATQ